MRKTILMKTIVPLAGFLMVAQGLQAQLHVARGSHPDVLPIRERAALVQKITQKRLDTLLPRLMR